MSFLMKRLQVSGIVAVALALCFGAGMWAERWLIDRRLVAEPCSVRTWQPSIGFVYISIDPGDCLPRGQSRVFDGEWADFAYGGGFRPTAAKSDKVFDFVAGGVAKAQIQWLSDNKRQPVEVSGRTYRVRFVGRTAHRHAPALDGHTDVVILERVLYASALPNRKRAN